MKKIKMRSLSPADFILNFCIVIMCLLSLFPIYWLFSGSVKYSADIMKIPPDWVPSRITMMNYRNIFVENPALRWVFNSMFVSVVTTIGIIMVSSATGYALSKINFAGKKIIFSFVIAGLILPKEVYLLPLYQMMVDFGWIGSLKALIFPDIAMPFGVYLLTQFYDGIPNEIGESAEMDGCDKIRFFIYFGLPLSKPGIGALGILSFIRVWNSYLWQFVMAAGEKTYTLPVGIAGLFDDPFNIDFGLKFAGAAVTAIPLLTIFVIFQRYFTSGVTAGAVKG